MSQTLRIRCSRAQADEVEAKLQALDPEVRIDVADDPRMSGVVDGLSIAASLSAIAASSFVIWAEARKISVEKTSGDETAADERPSGDPAAGDTPPSDRDLP